MTQLYRFSVEVKEVKGISRVIDIARDAKLADLAYVILSAFQTFAYHLWEIRYQGKHYDCMVCVEDFFGEDELIDATETVISDIHLKEGATMTMEYDYGCGWEFEIKLTKIYDTPENNSYPLVVSGKGSGILEDLPPFMFAELQKKVDKSGPINLPKELAKEFGSDYNPKDKQLRDYRVFNLEECNEKLADEFDAIREDYEKRM